MPSSTPVPRSWRWTNDGTKAQHRAPARATFSQTVQTANGAAKAARVKLDRVRIGGIEVRDVDALVTRDGARCSVTLLGMSFLNRLSKFEIRGDELMLRQ